MRWLYAFRIKELNEKAPPGIHIVLVGNKIDLESLRQVTKEQGQAYAEQQGLTYCEVSAKLNLGVTEMFEDLAKQMPLDTKNSGFSIDSQPLTAAAPVSSRCC